MRHCSQEENQPKLRMKVHEMGVIIGITQSTLVFNTIFKNSIFENFDMWIPNFPNHWQMTLHPRMVLFH